MMSTRFSILALACLTVTATAQESNPAEAAAGSAEQALLSRALGTMAALPSVAFKTVEATDQAMTRRFRDQMGGETETEVAGSSGGGIVKARLNYDADQVITHAGRTVARASEGEWKPRQGVLAGGQPMPFVLDPELFFEMLGSLPADALQVKRHEKTTYKDLELVILTLAVEGRTAREFGMTGVLPRIPSPMFRALGGGMGDAMPQPEVTTDIAIFVDPKTALIHRIRCKSYEESPMLANVQFKVAGDGGQDIDVEENTEEDDTEENDAQGNRIYKKGLPVRRLGQGTSLLDFDITFTDHGKAAAPELDATARKLLKIKG